jgi:Hsp20/alpha crystallin family
MANGFLVCLRQPGLTSLIFALVKMKSFRSLGIDFIQQSYSLRRLSQSLVHPLGEDEKKENYRRIERQYGSFTRSFTLPSSVDPTQVSAQYDKGVLNVNLAKKTEAKPKQIKISVGSEKALPCWFVILLFGPTG